MSPDVRKSHLWSQVQEFYGVGPSYAEAYIDYWFRSTGRQYASLAEILASKPPKPMWFDFALTSNLRGDTVYQRLAPYLSKSGKRYLDVGCGFGGFLVAFSKADFEVKGIDIDPVRIALAQANCRDHRLRDCIFEANILELGSLGDLGTFDVITCNDVIEHVSDASRAIRNMVQMLNRGGVLFMEIPNRDSLHFIASDGHFELFGITLLDRQDAIDYHRAKFNFEYDVGEYYPLEYYRSLLVEEGCEPGLIPLSDATSIQYVQSARSVARALRAYVGFALDRSRSVPPHVRRKLKLRFLDYIMRLLLDLLPAVGSRRQRDSFRLKYLTDFWSLLAVKRGEGL